MKSVMNKLCTLSNFELLMASFYVFSCMSELEKDRKYVAMSTQSKGGGRVHVGERVEKGEKGYTKKK